MAEENTASVMQGTHKQGSEAASRSSSHSVADVNRLYFTDEKSGEVNELMNMLQQSSLGRDPTKKRNVIKKVIAYMTLGIDVSRLFSPMMMAIETKDLVVKKMVYLYLCNYAASNPELAIMCINTLQRDCSNEDPMARGLALRSLCGLRIPSAVEYMLEPIRRGLEDSNSYVRKTAVIGVLRLFHFDRTQVEENGLVDSIYAMLNDVDHQVVTNCLYALQEMMADDGGMAVNQSIILGLLSQVEKFSEWGLCQIIDLVTCYDPVDEEEMFTIMNLLDPVLRTNNSGVVLSTMKCFLHITRHSPSLQDQVYERLKAPLLTLMAVGSTEIVHCILAHLDILIPRCPGLYDEDFRLFYVRDNEPQNIKYAKVKLLSLLANPSNYSEIISELSEYVGDIGTGLSSRALMSIGHIAHRCPESVPLATAQLVGFLDSSATHIKSRAVISLQHLLTKYPEWRGHGIPRLRSVLRDLQDAEARAAVVWMLGHWGAEVQEAPYMLEKIINTYEEESVAVKRILITATVRLFFVRPPEVQAMLGRLLTQALNDVTSRDIQDKALFYTRLLKTDAYATKAVICADLPRIEGELEEDKDNPLKEAIFGELNSLSVLYDELSQDFILPQYQVKGGSVTPLRVKEIPEALSEGGTGTGTAPPLDTEKVAGLKIEPNTAVPPQDSSSFSSGGILLDVSEETTAAGKALTSPTSATRATYMAAVHSISDSGGASYLTNPSTSFDLESSMMKSAQTERPIPPLWNSECGVTGNESVENHLSDMLHGEPRATTTTKDDGESTDEIGTDLSVDNATNPTLYMVRCEMMDPNHYQRLWAELPELNSVQDKRMRRIPSADDVESCLATRHIYTIATGEDDKVIKFFFYCESQCVQLEDSGEARALHLIQCNISKAMESYSIIVKSTSKDQTVGQALAGIMDEELNRAC